MYDLYFRNEDARYDNFLDMLYVKFGKAITDKFLKPYNEKLYAVDLHKLDKYAMARTMKQAKQTMIDALKKDMKNVLHTDNLDDVIISIAHTHNQEAAEKFREELLAEFPGKDIWIDPLSLSVSCHIGPGALACTVTKKLIDIN